jgi:hypothetical protein
MKELLKDCTAVAGSVRSTIYCHILRTIDAVDPAETPHAYACYWVSDEGGWGWTPDDFASSKVLWTPLSAATCDHPQCQMIAISPWGHVLVDGKGDFHEEVIRDQDKAPVERKGKLLRVRGIGQRAYVVGMGRQVYRRDDAHRWTPIDQSVLVPADNMQLLGFNSIDGFSETDIYAVGLKGEIWHFNGKRWQQLDSPTNRILNDAVCAGDGQVYACGDEGFLLRGRNDNWSIITDESFKRDIWNLCWFADRLFIATTQGLFFLNDKGQVKSVDFGGDMPKTTYHLSARDGILWSIGSKDIMQFDGKTWTRID